MGIGSFAIQLQMWSLNAVNTVMIDKNTSSYGYKRMKPSLFFSKDDVLLLLLSAFSVKGLLW